MLYVWSIVALINLATFVVFGADKWKAKRHRRRVPEVNLLTMSWVFGLVGGWIAMSVFRHKTSKLSFRIKMIVVSVLNPLWVLGWLTLR